LTTVHTALDEARRAGNFLVVPYLLVDRQRTGRLAARVRALREGGAAAIEIGVPFSDPIADGPTLAAASHQALLHGTDWSDLRATVRIASRELPVAVMSYTNPLLRRGLTTSLTDIARDGATALVVPDLAEDDTATWGAEAASRGIDLVRFIAPGASPSRIDDVARHARGYVYLVTRYGITGARGASGAVDLGPLVREIRRSRPEIPILAGFGIRDPSSAARVAAMGVDGVIVGSALEERWATGERVENVRHWIRRLVTSVSRAQGNRGLSVGPLRRPPGTRRRRTP
jgi:tryptophan synthase alpha chain